MTGALAALAGSARLSVTTRARALRELPALDAACASHVLVASGTDLAHLPAVLCQHTDTLVLAPTGGRRSHDYLPNAMVADCVEARGDADAGEWPAGGSPRRSPRAQ